MTDAPIEFLTTLEETICRRLKDKDASSYTAQLAAADHLAVEDVLRLVPALELEEFGGTRTVDVLDGSFDCIVE